jgi:16S rRNA (cytidine1402-2'-O)-methyltransferase
MSKLYVVPTPVGNLEDMTVRAIKVLKNSDIILAEDTRKTSILLRHFEINAKKLISHHKFNEHKTIGRIIEMIRENNETAIVSDAGTPSISDPGYMLVKACIDNDIEVECLPGATSLIPALVNSGFPSDRFCFEGFLPVKKGRQKKLAILAEEERTMIFFESPYRLLKTLNEFRSVFGEQRKVSVSREISKIYEETIRGTIPEVIEYFSKKTVKGELVVVLAGKEMKVKSEE